MKKTVSKQTFFATEELYPSLPCIPRLPWFQSLPSQVPAIINSNLLPLLICAEASNTLSLHHDSRSERPVWGNKFVAGLGSPKNTFKLRADQKQNPVNPSNPEILSKNESTFPSQLLPFTIFTPKIISQTSSTPRRERTRHENAAPKAEKSEKDTHPMPVFPTCLHIFHLLFSHLHGADKHIQSTPRFATSFREAYVLSGEAKARRRRERHRTSHMGKAGRRQTK
jgi:hypothetical protein